MSSVRVLLVEDSPSDAALFKAHLEGTAHEFDVEWVPTFAEGCERVDDADCTLLDLTLPDAHGLDSVRGLARVAPDMPVIVLTGYGDEAGGVEAVRLGAQDYLLKDDIDARELGRAIRYAIERKHAEAELVALTTELEERTRKLALSNNTIFDDSYTAMLQIDEDTRVLGGNRAMALLAGAPQSELAGRQVASLFGEPDASTIESTVVDVFETGIPHRRDALLNRLDGTTRLTALQLSRVTMDQSGSNVVLMTVGDITAGSSAMLRQANDQKLAELGRLAAGLAHEIRSPLQYVTTSMEFARSAVDDLLDGSANSNDPEFRNDLRDSMAEVADGIARISEIVRGMNTLAHRAGSEMELHNINDVLDFPLAVARGQAPAGTEFIVTRGDAPSVRFRLGPIQQVLLNLLVNAVQAIEDHEAGGRSTGRVEVETSHDDNWVTIRVTDNGAGMDQATLEQAAEPFFTTKAQGRGTGQGLALVSDILNQHGGDVTIESTAGEGTTATIWLPRQRPERISQVHSA